MTKYFRLAISDNANPATPKSVIEWWKCELFTPRSLKPIARGQEKIWITEFDESDSHLMAYAVAVEPGATVGKDLEKPVVFMDLSELGPNRVELDGGCDDFMADFVRLKIERVKETWPATQELTPEDTDKADALTWADTAQPTPISSASDGQAERDTALLQRIYDHFVQYGEWPRYRVLEIEMGRVVPLHQIISDIGEGLLRSESPINEQSVCFLTLEGMARCQGSEREIGNFLRVVNLFAERYVRNSATTIVNNNDLISALGISETEARRICELIWRNGGDLGVSVHRGPDGRPLEYRVSNKAFYFEGVNSLSDYLAQKMRAGEAEIAEAALGRLRSQPQITKVTDDPATLRQNIVKYFDDSELRNLCFDMGVDYENLKGESKSDKARELVAYCERHSRVSELFANCRRLYPDVSWEGEPE